jgi:hypothetical protein
MLPKSGEESRDYRTAVEVSDDLNEDDRRMLDLIIENAFEGEVKEFDSFEYSSSTRTTSA